jgi:hypothetical protein
MKKKQLPDNSKESTGEFIVRQLMGLSAFVNASSENKGVWIELFAYINNNSPHESTNQLMGTIPNGANYMSIDWASISPRIGLKQIRADSTLWAFHNLNAAGHKQDIVVWATPAWGALMDYYEQL